MESRQQSQGRGNQHFISQAAVACFCCSKCVHIKNPLSSLYVKLQYWSGHGLTCLGGSPSHEPNHFLLLIILPAFPLNIQNLSAVLSLTGNPSFHETLLAAAVGR